LDVVSGRSEGERRGEEEEGEGRGKRKRHIVLDLKRKWHIFGY
jgi:hypothetical protein